MNNRILVGTLSTLNTLMAPLAGTHDPTVPTYKLVAPHTPTACARGDEHLGLHIDSNFESSMTVQVTGTVCGASGTQDPSRHEVDFAVLLPSDLLDEDFLRRLPTNAAYVIAGLPVAKGSNLKTRVKITKLAADRDGIPLAIEWLPDSRGHIEHAPMMLWLKRSFAGNIGLPWEKVRFSELSGQIQEPLVLAGTLENEKPHPTKLR